MTVTGGGGSTVSPALAEALGCTTLSAVMVTFIPGTADGAVYRPFVVIVPSADVPPGIPFTCHMTAVFPVPEMDAVNCCDWLT